jgi:hypothetical protein
MKLLSADQVKIGGVYLSRRSYNSKTITWEVCEVLNIFSDKYQVKFLEDDMIASRPFTEQRLGKRNGHYGLFDEPTMAEVDRAWFLREQREIERLEAQVLRRQKTLIKIGVILGHATNFGPKG